MKEIIPRHLLLQKNSVFYFTNLMLYKQNNYNYKMNRLSK